mgnify:CR=1 FL=1
MTTLEIWLLAVSLAMDCFSVSITSGIILRRTCWKTFITIGLFFGLFQAVMPLIGWCATNYFYHLIEQFDHWIAFGLLILIGLNMIRETIWGDDDDSNDDFGVRTMALMAVATSIDALAVGVSFAFIHANIWSASAIIGVVTFALSAMGLYLGRKIGSRLGSKAGLLGGLVLIGIGIKILIEHLSH